MVFIERFVWGKKIKGIKITKRNMGIKTKGQKKKRRKQRRIQRKKIEGTEEENKGERI
ncbi:hypothetical protein VSQ48_14370 [Candidatus Ventrimonas sp. KK005]